MTIEIVDFRMNDMVIFHSYVSLPEGNFQGFFDPHWIGLREIYRKPWFLPSNTIKYRAFL